MMATRSNKPVKSEDVRQAERHERYWCALRTIADMSEVDGFISAYARTIAKEVLRENQSEWIDDLRNNESR